MTTSPPRLLRRFLAWALPAGRVRDGLIGDLDELYVARAARNRALANVWYARQALAASARYAGRRSERRNSAVGRSGVLNTLQRDVLYAFRMLHRKPGFTAVVVLTLALGIGANTAVFSVVRSVLLQPLPYADDDRLAVLLIRAPDFNFEDYPSSPPEYVAYRDNMRSWEQLAAYRVQAATIVHDGADSERVDVALITPNLLATLGVAPAVGRPFSGSATGNTTDQGVLLGHAYWMSRYGGDPGILGRSIRLDGEERTVVGVMDERFAFPNPGVSVWLPLAFTAEGLQRRGDHTFSLVGRLRDGITFASAEAELQSSVRRFVADRSFNFHGWHPAYLRSLRTELVGDASRTLWLMMGAVVLVLLIACANVANLFLVRAEERGREMSLRSALGASRRRVVSMLLTESLLVALAGGLAGILVAHAGLQALGSFAPAGLPRLAEIRMDGRVLVFSSLMTITAGLLFGLVPALHARKADLHGSLRENNRSGTAGRGRVRMRQLLVVSETALAVILLISAGLLLRSFQRLMTVDPGFRSERVLTAAVTVPGTTYDEGHEVVAFYETLRQRIESLAGVARAGAIWRVPLGDALGPADIEVEGWIRPSDAPRPVADVQAVTPGYFAALGIPVVEGRSIEVRDGLDAPLVAVVSESLAESYWPGRSPIGGHIRRDGDNEPFAEVIGVVPDIRHDGPDRPAVRGTLYLAHAQTPIAWATLRTMTLVVRTDVEPRSLVSAIRREVQSLDESVPVYRVRTMEQAIADVTATRRFSMFLQALFALLALALAIVGLYGVLAYTVARRTAEMGIRMALGANRKEVQGMVVRQGMTLVGIAIVLGLGGAVATGRLLRSLLFDVSAFDPVTYFSVIGLLGLTGLFACWVPARRASRADAADALRAS